MRTNQVSIGPAPFTLAEMKTHLRIDHSDEDAYIQSCFAAATNRIQNYIRRTISNETWKVILDEFPSSDDQRIFLPRGQIQSVANIVYADTSSTTVTLTGPTSSVPGAQYQESFQSDVAPFLLPPYGESWPSITSVIDPVVIQFVSGYGDYAGSPIFTAFPEQLLQSIKVQAADYYTRRTTDDAENPAWHAASAICAPFVLPLYE